MWCSDEGQGVGEAPPAGPSTALGATSAAALSVGAEGAPSLDYAEFLLWVDRNCMDAVGARSLEVLKGLMMKRVKEDIDIAAILRTATPADQQVDLDTFSAFTTSMGLLLCRPSLAMLFDALVGDGADVISLPKLLRILSPVQTKVRTDTNTP